MANAAAEKLKDLGIRHGEKAVVGLTATLFVVFTALAVVRPTLEMKPDELKTAATQAGSNLQKKQDMKDILAKLEKDGLKEPNFEKVIEGQIANALKPDDYRTKFEWVSPEPGAGLIRDQPELIAPTELYAFPGRGGVLMYALKDGERVVATPEEIKKKGTRRRRTGMMPGMMGGSGMARGGASAPKEDTPEAKKKRELEEENRKNLFAGSAEAKEKEKEKAKPEAEPEPEGNWKEETVGKRWIVITGVIDNEKLKKNYLLALKSEALAYPNYKRIDVERQTRQADGSWSEWGATDQDRNYEVLDNVPELDAEFVPESQRPAALVDPLPFLRAGYWTGVHVARLVPRDVLEPAKQAAGPGPGGGRYPGPGMMGGGQEGSKGMGGRLGSGMGTGTGPGGPGRGGMSMPGSGGKSGGRSPGAGPEEMNFAKHDEPSLMLRSLDFTVEADHTYRFRVRIVVANPNKDRTDVNPGVNTEDRNLIGPWSDPTDPITVPADVVAYAQAPEPNTRRDDTVSFQVIRWDPGHGQTVIKNDVAAPGELVGEVGAVPMPDSDGEGVKSVTIDFNSRATVLDTFGGRQKLPDIGVERNQFEVPALAMIIEPDGSVVVRSQARDKADEVRQDMDDNYKQAIKDSTVKREPGGGSRIPGSGGKKRKGGKR